MRDNRFAIRAGLSDSHLATGIIRSLLCLVLTGLSRRPLPLHDVVIDTPCRKSQPRQPSPPDYQPSLCTPMAPTSTHPTNPSPPLADKRPRRGTTFTISTGSEPVVNVYPRRSNPGSVHSPATSSSSRSSASTDSWSHVDRDDLEPSDSASHSRTTSSRRHTTEARPAPTRRHSSRRTGGEREELPRRETSHRHRQGSTSRPRRTESRRTPSDDSGSVASYDDYPYGHPGAPQPPRAGYPPQQSGYRHVPAQSQGGYPPSMMSAPPYQDPYAAHQQALVHMPHQDGFPYQQPNPFSPQHQQPNPFSPMSAAGGSSYFATDPHATPQSMGPPPRPHGPGRPQSFVATSQYGSEMMYSPPQQQHAGLPSGMPFSPYVMPGYAPPWGYLPPSQTSSPAQPAEVKKAEPDPKTVEEMNTLRAMIKQHEDEKRKQEEDRLAAARKADADRLAAEAARLKQLEAEIAELARKKAAEEEEKKKNEEIAAASKTAKEDAEKKASEAAKKAKDEHDKKFAEAKAAQEEAEKKNKALEAEAAKNKPDPDSLKAPIKFTDAVGRKFSFPWHVCKSWKGMENLIKQAFNHIDVMGEHVRDGHYDLTGPDGEIILPQVWDTMIRPDWEVTMHFWPMPEKKPEEIVMLPDMFDDLHIRDVGLGKAHKKTGSNGGKSGKNGKKALSPDQQFAEMFGSPMMPPPPPQHHAPPGHFVDVFPGGPAVVVGGAERPRPPKPRTKSSKELTGFAAWIAGSGGVKAKRKS